MKSIIKQRFDRTRNAEHYQYHSDALAVLTAVLATKYNIAHLRDAYAALFAQEEEAFAQNQAYEETKVIETKDLKRDNLWLYIKQTIDSKLLSPDAAEVAVAEKLTFAIKPYRTANELPYAENTAQISGFVEDMKREDLAEDIEKLSLTNAVAQLAVANADFNATYTARSNEKLTRVSADSMKTLRPRVDKAFAELTNAINVLYQANELTAKIAETTAELGNIIDRINALSVQLKQTLAYRTGDK
jgi:hypothetical protein